MKLIKKVCVLSDGSLKPMYIQSFLNPSFKKATQNDNRSHQFNQKFGTRKKKGGIIYKPFKKQYSLTDL